ncbi:MAG: tetratricopeptide repeat protein, partial [Stackebrandtia sp.]
LNTAVWMQATDYFLGILYGRTGEYEKGFRYLADAEDLCRRQPTTGAVANNGLAKARLLIDTGRFAEAEAEIGAVAHLLDDSADNRGRCMYLSGLGDLALSRGDKPGACQLFEEMRSVAHHYDLSFTESEARSRLAVVLNGMGEHDAALSGIEALLNADLRPQGPLIEAVVALAAAVVYNGAGRFGDAERYGARAVAAFGDMPNPLQHGRSLMAVADAQSGLGDHVAAEAHRRRALSIFTELGVPEAGTV